MKIVFFMHIIDMYLESILYTIHISMPRRIHGAAIYGNMDPINIPQSC